MNKNSDSSDITRAIFQAGLLAGILDGIAASTQFAIVRNGNPLQVFNFVASGVYGQEALSGGNMMTLLGIIFHLVIATMWAAAYFKSYTMIKKITANWVITGILYGAFVWTCMNLIVLPLSNTPPLTYTLKSVSTGMSIIIVCIGLPIAYLSHRFYNGKS